jgi:hypothetical protein
MIVFSDAADLDSFHCRPYSATWYPQRSSQHFHDRSLSVKEHERAHHAQRLLLGLLWTMQEVNRSQCCRKYPTVHSSRWTCSHRLKSRWPGSSPPKGSGIRRLRRIWDDIGRPLSSGSWGLRPMGWRGFSRAMRRPRRDPDEPGRSLHRSSGSSGRCAFVSTVLRSEDRLCSRTGASGAALGP